MNNRKQFLLTQRACVELYPPVLHQAALLSKIGEVTMIDALAKCESSAVQTADAIKRIRIPTKDQSSQLLARIKRFQSFRRYRKEVHREMSAIPDLVIGFEPEAAYTILKAKKIAKKTKRIVHLHEVPWKEHYGESINSRLAIRYLLKNLYHADAVVVPDYDRAEFIQSIAGLKSAPLVVMNCPRKLAELPQPLLITFLRERGISSSRIVHYQGAVGPDHNLETVIKSMRFWPSDAIFVIVGGGREQYLNELIALTVAEGVQRRVVLTGRVPYNQVFQYAVGASVGVTILDPAKKNWELSAGASNKRFEYAALGIPQVTNDGPGIKTLFGQTGIAAIADHEDISDVGKKISQFLLNDVLRQEVGAKARQIHLQAYNYEQQFQKVLELLS